MYGGNNRARVDRRSPSAWAICDFCNKQVNRTDLVPDRQYMGTEVRPTGFLVCKFTCVDVPQPQQKAIRLPPDPLPVENPRVDNFPSGNFGFTQYLLGNQGQTPANPMQAYPVTKTTALASLAALSGIATPMPYADHSATVAASNTTQTLMSANPARVWLAIYSPGPLFAISTGHAAYGSASNIIVGPGECWFWATAQGYGTVYQGAMTVVSLQKGASVFAWDA